MDLIDFINQSNNSLNRDELTDSFVKFLNAFGISQFFVVDLSYCAFSAANEKKINILISYPESVQDIYLFNDVINYDSIYKKALTAQRPFIWEEISGEKREYVIYNIIENEKDLTACDGIGVSIHNPFGKTIGIAFSGLEKDKKIGKDIFSILYVASHHFYSVYTTFISRIPDNKDIILTEREREVLMWIARGKSKSDTATILSISQSSVKRHCENIFAKLKVNNLPSAVAKAMKLGLVNFFSVFWLNLAIWPIDNFILNNIK